MTLKSIIQVRIQRIKMVFNLTHYFTDIRLSRIKIDLSKPKSWRGSLCLKEGRRRLKKLKFI